MPSLLSVLLSLLLALAPAAAFAQDLAGSRDPEVVGERFPGAVIVHYEAPTYDEVDLAAGPVRQSRQLEEKLSLEGEVEVVHYRIAPGVSSPLEVQRAYEEALAAKGFEILFQCRGEDCGGRAFNHTVTDGRTGFGEEHRHQRYLLARLQRPGEAEVHLSLYTTQAAGLGGPRKDEINQRLVVVVGRPFGAALEAVSAEEMQSALGEEGQVALYGILFAFDSAELLPESEPVLTEIASLLGLEPGLSLLIVGHTDNVGGLDYNLGLSQRRAAAVRQALVQRHAIAAERLESHGVGFLAPVASNRSEEGRALNRRVVLVER